MNRIILLVLLLSLQNCALTEGLGLQTYGAIPGSTAKSRISDAILEAEATATAAWLNANGMTAGTGPILPLILINGVLAKLLYPFTTKISDKDYFMESSVEQCESDIRTRGALVLGASYTNLAPSGAVGSARDAALLPQFASCDLEKTGKVITIDGLIKL
ncbi:lipoprotein [Leptospira ryugenii]|uniref:Lipoprotein n=1 Tax=Leptospira ryugenii TaxID=1917863 RepID=A0A2P2DV85_9LEPT|nr:TIGR04452 family lipoprotein [Leptospira ryugenii]GBF48542.1 lipoprotein [Leptospira ryugenii]